MAHLLIFFYFRNPHTQFSNLCCGIKSFKSFQQLGLLFFEHFTVNGPQLLRSATKYDVLPNIICLKASLYCLYISQDVSLAELKNRFKFGICFGYNSGFKSLEVRKSADTAVKGSVAVYSSWSIKAPSSYTFKEACVTLLAFYPIALIFSYKLSIYFHQGLW